MILNADADRLDLPSFEIGIGVNTGIVIAGTLGGPGRLDYTVLGDPVNIAQRLQATAVGGEILATAATVREAGADQAEPVGLKQLKGRQEPVATYRIRWDQTSPQPFGGPPPANDPTPKPDTRRSCAARGDSNIQGRGRYRP